MLKNQNIKEANSIYSVGLNIVEDDTGKKFEEAKLNLSNNYLQMLFSNEENFIMIENISALESESDNGKV